MSFRAVMLLAMTTLAALMGGAVLLGTEVTLSREVLPQLSSELVRSAASLQRHLAAQARRLEAEARVVASEPRLKAALASPAVDDSTLVDMADELLASAGWDAVAIVGQGGALRALRGALPAPLPSALDAALKGVPSSGHWIAGDGLYQIAVVPLRYGDLVFGALLAGTRLDDRRAAELNLESEGEVALVVDGKLLASTFPSGDPRRDALAERVQGPLPSPLRLGSEQFLLASSRGAAGLGVVALRSEDRQLGPLRRLRIALIGVTAAALLLGVGVAFFAARRLSVPVAQLVCLADAVGRGDLSARAPAGGSTELRRLAASLNAMVERIAREAAVRQRAEAQLLLSDRLSSMGRLAAGVAHEVNNPLAYVVSNLAYLTDALARLDAKHPDALKAALPELIEVLRECQDGTERVGRIVRELKTFSRADEDEGVVELIPVLQSSLSMARSEIRHRAQVVEEFGESPAVLASASRLGQVFLNLLINAAQAIPPGTPSAHEIRVVTRTAPDGRAVVEVCDTGGGIPAQVREHIFEPFFSTKPVGIGTGLGLSISHSIVTGLGGAIEVESEPGVGTIFRVLLLPAPN